MRAIILRFEGGPEFKGWLNDCASADVLWSALPISGEVSRWGSEIYIETDVETALEASAKQIVDKGDICIWSEARVLAIPFGPTPISLGDECRLVAPVNVVGKIDSPLGLEQIREGDSLTLVRG
ncbi:MAG: hypothetical protein KC561_05210 [Myxococcales bacterium]|nr:hypothetical protein [Myxococcales bacterium]